LPSKDGEAWNAFELDPQVVRIGSDPTLLRSLSAPDLRIVLGDARLTLAALPEQYDLIVVNAFTSDAIPVHLLTRETFAGYLSLLTARGAIVLHISNRHMALWRPTAAVGAAEGLVAYGKGQLPRTRPTTNCAPPRRWLCLLGMCGISAICQRSQDGSASIPIDA